MTRKHSRKAVPLAVLAALCTGTAFVGIPSCEGVLTTFNPCGSVFSFCDPYEIDLLFADTPDFNLDPTCTIPFFGVYGTAGGATGGGGTGATTTGNGCSDIIVFPQTPGTRPEGQQP